ncbi:MAG: ABC transporter substrate-binding protein, partial [Acidobacteriota bacterium]
MIGQRLDGRYELLSELGKGGMGVVYLARDPVLDREVAVKTLHPGYMSKESIERLRREAQVVAKMDHPAITPVFDLGTHQGALFLVMPVLSGKTLRTLLDEGGLSLGDALGVIVQVAEALDYSHARGVIHRDVKPENVMVSPERGELRARVMDFGLARDPSTRASLTMSGGVIGTLAYMSPEQVQAMPIDHRADLYSLGALLYECLAGRAPFTGPMHRLIVEIAQDAARPVGEHVEVDAELERLIASCLEKSPDRRPENGREISAVLREALLRLDGDALGQAVAHAPASSRPSRLSVTPIIGRDEEIEEIGSRLQDAVDGECQLVLIEGEAGVGKTRLLEEVGRLAEARGLRVVRGRVADRQNAPPFQAFCEVVQDYFRSHESTPRASSVIADLSDLAGELVARFPIFSEIEGLRVQAGDALPKASDDDATRVYELFARTLLRLAGGRPLVVLFENLHLGDASVDALAYIVRRLGASSTLFAATFRSSEVDGDLPLSRLLRDLGEDSRTLRLRLGPLDGDSVRELVHQQLASGHVSDDLVAQLQRVSEGNPLFAIELIKSLRTSREIQRDRSGTWTLDERASLGGDRMPRTIQQAIERHVERLPEEHQRFLQLAAVVGRSFEVEDLEELEVDADVDTVADDLIAEGLLMEDRRARSDRLFFQSGLVREVLERQVPRRKRRRLHRQLARRLEARRAGKSAVPALLHHCAEGDLAAETVSYGLELTRRAVEASAYSAAIRAASTALDFVDEEEVDDSPRARGELLVLLAKAERGRGLLDRALSHGEKALRQLRGLDPAMATVAARLLAESAWQAGRVDDVRRYLEQGLELARGADPVAVAESHLALLTLGATVANLRGEHRVALRYLEEASALEKRSAPTALAQVARGGRLTVGMTAEVQDLDPVVPHSLEEDEVMANVFETLLVTEDAHPAPVLASDWEEVDGAVEVTLRRDVHFSDGEPLTAEAVRRSLERAARDERREAPPAVTVLRGADAFLRGEVEGLDGVEVLGEHRLRFYPREALPIFPTLLSHPSAAVVRETEDGLVGTGPFVVRAQRQDGDRFITHLEPNPRWRKPRPPLDQVEVRSGLNASALASGLRSGELDIVRDLFPEDLEDLLREARFRSGLVEMPQNNLYFVLLNQNGPATRDPRVRRALASTVLPEDLVWRSLGRFAQPAVSVIPPGLLGHDAGRRTSYMSSREAKSLLAEAGHGHGLKLRGAIHPLLRERYGLLTLRLLDEWRGLGVEVELEEPTLDELRAAYRKNEHLDVLISRWIADVEDPDDFTYGFFHSEAGKFSRWFCDPEVDGLLVQARRERDPAQRISLYRRFESRLGEQAAMVPLFHDLQVLLAAPHVVGLSQALRPPYLHLEGLARSAPSVSESPLPGGELTVALPGRLNSLDPTGGDVFEAVETLPLIFETLTRVEEGAHTAPWLAASVESRAGGRRFEIELRDARFHGGRRLTSRDVRWSFERVLRTPLPSIHHLLLPIRGARELREGGVEELAGLRVLSDRRLEIELERPLPFFPTLLSHPLTGIVPEGVSEIGGTWREGSAGTGPFRVLRFSPDDRLELERNPDYWRPGFPRSERLTFQFSVSSDEMSRRYRRGQLSLASDLRPAEIEALRRDPTLASGYREQPRLATYFLVCNVHHGVLASSDRRRRLARLFSADTGLSSAAGRLAIPAMGLIPPGLLGAVDTPAPPTEGLPSSSTSERLTLSAILHPVFAGPYAAVWSRLQALASAAGLSVEAEVLPPSQALERARAGAADLLAF